MYVPAWETLSDAVSRVVATGLDMESARKQICSAIADGAITIRVEVARTDRDIPGKLRLRGQGHEQVKPPHRLSPQELDWKHSRPLGAWNTGPDRLESYAVIGWGWRARNIKALEVRTDDVTEIFGLALSIPAGGNVDFGNDPRAIPAAPSHVTAPVPHPTLAALSAPPTATFADTRPETAPAAHEPSKPRGHPAAYSPQALGAWFMLRVRTWVNGVIPPTESQDLTAAADFFASKPPRDEFRRIRRDKTPENWRKSGPSSGRL